MHHDRVCSMHSAMLLERLALGSLMTPGCLAYQSSSRPMLGWITLTPACAAAMACTRLQQHCLLGFWKGKGHCNIW